MIKSSTYTRVFLVAGTACFILYLASPGDSQPQQKALVFLQGSSPGTTQAGHSNITGIGIFGGLQTSSFLMTNGAGAGKVLQSDANGVGTWQAAAGGLTLPFTGSADVAGSSAFHITNTNSDSGYGVFGQSSGANGIGLLGIGSVGVLGTGTNIGGQFSSSGIGVYGNSASETGTAVFGEMTSTTGINYGVYGKTASFAGYAVYGIATATINSPVAGYFRATGSNEGTGVIGIGNSAGVLGRNDHDSGAGVQGIATASAGEVYGGYFNNQSSPGGAGVFAKGINVGVDAQSTSDTGIAVAGVSVSSSGLNRGGYFESNSSSGRGVEGYARRVGGVNYGGYFSTESGSGYGVFGLVKGSTGVGAGVYGLGSTGGRFESNSPFGAGAIAICTAGSGPTIGLFAQVDSVHSDSFGGYFRSFSGTGVWAESQEGTGVKGTGLYYGVYGEPIGHIGDLFYGVYGNNSDGYGVYANGDLGASGTKSFRIDHPFDPLNKYLTHYCAEGPEPLLIYSGTVKTDGKGEAWVQLPDYFSEINKDLRYQLTVVEDEDTDQFVQAKVSRKVQNNRFKIRTSAPHTEVCWEVKGVRNDLWVRKHGAPVETDKEGREKGKYQHPELYGAPPEMGSSYSPKSQVRRPERTPPQHP